MKKMSATTLSLFTALVLITTTNIAHARPLKPAEHDNIIGGTVVQAGDPVAASTVLITDGSFICTGSVIEQDIVVTAAHCTSGSASALQVMFVTDMSQANASNTLGITGYIANPGFQGDSATGPDEMDISIMRLNGPLPPGAAPAAMLSASASAALNAGDMAVLSGYGITDANTQDGAGVLRRVDQVPVVSPLGKTEVILQQSQGTGACHGDSGGPAFIQKDGQLQLWGLTNRGYPDNAPDDCAHESVYTRIAAYADWIAASEATLRQGN